MKAIQTHYIAPKQSRASHSANILAKAEGVRAVSFAVPYDYEDSLELHQRAAMLMCKKYGWDATKLCSGMLPGGDYAHCFSS